MILSKTFFDVILVELDSLVLLTFESNQFASNHDLIESYYVDRVLIDPDISSSLVPRDQVTHTVFSIPLGSVIHRPLFIGACIQSSMNSIWWVC